MAGKDQKLEMICERQREEGDKSANEESGNETENQMIEDVVRFSDPPASPVHDDDGARDSKKKHSKPDEEAHRSLPCRKCGRNLFGESPTETLGSRTHLAKLS